MGNVDQSLLVHPPAKVNLILKIFDRLPNGYHALWSFMQTVGVTDELTIRVTDAFEGVRLECPDTTLPAPTDNLAYRAAELVLERAGVSTGVALKLVKGIPVEAGLGGGSSDAAATIMGLNRLLDLGWTNGDMAALGGTLGSDVPFFMEAPTAVVHGWGQRMIPKTLDGVRWIILVNPGFPINTAQAFRRLDEVRQTIPALPGALESVERASSVSWGGILALMENDFEAALIDDYPVLADIKRTLLSMGAEGALLSGSGATVFGVFQEQAEAIRAKEVFSEAPEYRIAVGPSLQGGLLERTSSVGAPSPDAAGRTGAKQPGC
ncbi:MAG: 4-(cytidine 5'-diphospho)-2-C-methyl-D-erythritol kinase [Nitrospira sp. SB0662_bin_26]|nr:4-(cytidine 5'-diphospho)-2-C-methyl-D-erythritol kinase [Nitrospira sp. SB0662_bin_26]